MKTTLGDIVVIITGLDEDDIGEAYPINIVWSGDVENCKEETINSLLEHLNKHPAIIDSCRLGSVHNDAVPIGSPYVRTG